MINAETLLRNLRNVKYIQDHDDHDIDFMKFIESSHYFSKYLVGDKDFYYVHSVSKEIFYLDLRDLIDVSKGSLYSGDIEYSIHDYGNYMCFMINFRLFPKDPGERLHYIFESIIDIDRFHKESCISISRLINPIYNHVQHMHSQMIRCLIILD